MKDRNPRALRVGFDMDGVIADLDAAMAQGGGESQPTSRDRQQLWKRLRCTDNFWETLDEIEPGGVARLAALAAERRWEVIFLTTRPDTAGDPAQVQTQRWLLARGFPCPSVFVVRRSRGAIAAALELDVVVDDRPEGCVDVISDSAARAILVWGRAADLPNIAVDRLRIAVAGGLHESLDLLLKIDQERRLPEPPLRKLFQTLHARLTPAR
jgi:hypothetical protein